MRDFYRLVLLSIFVLSVHCTPYDPGMREWQGTIRSEDKDAGANDDFELSTSEATGGQYEIRDSDWVDANYVDPDILNRKDDQPVVIDIVICELDHATTKLIAGHCVIDSCEQGYGNCDGEDATGCEKRLNDTIDCGACGAFCSFANATATCSSGVCVLESCDEGFDDCNNDPKDGCETSLNTPLNCGACNNACPIPENGGVACYNGACTPTACERGWDDCDDDPNTFCETRIDTIENCGRCGRTCDSKISDRCRHGFCVCGLIGGRCARWEWCCSGLCLPWPCVIGDRSPES